MQDKYELGGISYAARATGSTSSCFATTLGSLLELLKLPSVIQPWHRTA
jgi:hypothetical protein